MARKASQKGLALPVEQNAKAGGVVARACVHAASCTRTRRRHRRARLQKAASAFCGAGAGAAGTYMCT
jgi:hypothetical protein